MWYSHTSNLALCAEVFGNTVLRNNYKIEVYQVSTEISVNKKCVVFSLKSQLVQALNLNHVIETWDQVTKKDLDVNYVEAQKCFI